MHGYKMADYSHCIWTLRQWIVKENKVKWWIKEKHRPFCWDFKNHIYCTHNFNFHALFCGAG